MSESNDLSDNNVIESPFARKMVEFKKQMKQKGMYQNKRLFSGHPKNASKPKNLLVLCEKPKVQFNEPPMAEDCENAIPRTTMEDAKTMNKSRNNSIKSRTIDTDIQPLADNSQSPKKYNTRQASFLNPSVMLSKIKEKSVLNGTYNVSNFKPPTASTPFVHRIARKSLFKDIPTEDPEVENKSEHKAPIEGTYNIQENATPKKSNGTIILHKSHNSVTTDKHLTYTAEHLIEPNSPRSIVQNGKSIINRTHNILPQNHEQSKRQYEIAQSPSPIPYSPNTSLMTEDEDNSIHNSPQKQNLITSKTGSFNIIAQCSKVNGLVKLKYDGKKYLVNIDDMMEVISSQNGIQESIEDVMEEIHSKVAKDIYAPEVVIEEPVEHIQSVVEPVPINDPVAFQEDVSSSKIMSTTTNVHTANQSRRSRLSNHESSRRQNKTKTMIEDDIIHMPNNTPIVITDDEDDLDVPFENDKSNNITTAIYPGDFKRIRLSSNMRELQSALINVQETLKENSPQMQNYNKYMITNSDIKFLRSKKYQAKNRRLLYTNGFSGDEEEDPRSLSAIKNRKRQTTRFERSTFMEPDSISRSSRTSSRLSSTRIGTTSFSTLFDDSDITETPTTSMAVSNSNQSINVKTSKLHLHGGRTPAKLPVIPENSMGKSVKFSDTVPDSGYSEGFFKVPQRPVQSINHKKKTMNTQKTNALSFDSVNTVWSNDTGISGVYQIRSDNSEASSTQTTNDIGTNTSIILPKKKTRSARSKKSERIPKNNQQSVECNSVEESETFNTFSSFNPIETNPVGTSSLLTDSKLSGPKRYAEPITGVCSFDDSESEKSQRKPRQKAKTRRTVRRDVAKVDILADVHLQPIKESTDEGICEMETNQDIETDSTTTTESKSRKRKREKKNNSDTKALTSTSTASKPKGSKLPNLSKMVKKQEYLLDKECEKTLIQRLRKVYNPNDTELNQTTATGDPVRRSSRTKKPPLPYWSSNNLKEKVNQLYVKSGIIKA